MVDTLGQDRIDRRKSARFHDRFHQMCGINLPDQVTCHGGPTRDRPHHPGITIPYGSIKLKQVLARRPMEGAQHMEDFRAITAQ